MSLRDELLSIRSQHGKLTPQIVLDAARKPGSPLHDRFEWDDTIAAQRFRESQAGDLIRKVKISFTAGDGVSKELRAFVVVRGEDPRSEYVPVEEAVQDPFTQKLVIREFEREWKRFRERYEHLVEFAQVISRDLGDIAS